jgi:hypothetical protein
MVLGVTTIERAESAARAERWDDAAALLWTALEEARVGGDPRALARVQTLAARITHEGGESARREAELISGPVDVPFVEAPSADAQPRRRWVRPWRIVLILGVLAFVIASSEIATLVNHGWFRPPPLAAGALDSRPGATSHPEELGIYLQPLGRFPPDLAKRAATAMRVRFPTTQIHVLHEVSIDASAIFGRQLSAEQLLVQLRSRYGPQPPGRMIVGLTVLDMRASETRWSFSFGGAERLVVVATARMNPDNYVGLDRFHADLDWRLDKMLARVAAFVYFGYPPSEDPDDLLTKRVLSLDQLDAVAGVLPPRG